MDVCLRRVACVLVMISVMKASFVVRGGVQGHMRSLLGGSGTGGGGGDTLHPTRPSCSLAVVSFAVGHSYAPTESRPC